MCYFFFGFYLFFLFFFFGFFFFFFFNDTATTEIYTLSLHDALPNLPIGRLRIVGSRGVSRLAIPAGRPRDRRSEEHTSELQSRLHLVCRLLLEKKKKINKSPTFNNKRQTQQKRQN